MPSPSSSETADVLVVGAGFAGLRALYTFRDLGFDVTVLEAAEGVGGVWYWNRYPGARCDVESYDYSYSFSHELEQEWRWSERYATQPEILRYIEHVADRFDLRRDIRLRQRVVEARFDETDLVWRVRTAHGNLYAARYLVMAVGNLSTTKRPTLRGLERFAGEVLHTAEWPHGEVDLSGRDVGVIGTGSSAIQAIPILARQARRLVVFQRTPAFTVPACNASISDAEDVAVKAGYRARREAARNSPTGLGFVPYDKSALEETEAQRRSRYEAAWRGAGFGFTLTYPDLLLDRAANDTAADFIRGKIAETVRHPLTRHALTPRGYPFGAKRPCVDSGYYETFNRPNVRLVDVGATPIVSVTPDGLITLGGHHRLGAVVFATGFDAMTGSLLRPEIVGRDGVTLRDKWVSGPVTHLGLGTAGFPNMFVIAGPGSPSLLSNVLLSIEEHVDWLAALLSRAREAGTEVIEVTPEAELEWTAHVAERADMTLYPQARSYYMGDEVAGKPRVFMPYAGGVRRYRRILEEVAADGYRGFALSPLAGALEPAA